MKQMVLAQLIEEASIALLQIPKVPAYVILKDWINRNLRGRLVAPHDMICWPKGCLACGLISQGVYEPVQKHYALWWKRKRPIYTVDDLLMGQAFLALLDVPKQAGLVKSLYHRHQLEQGIHEMMQFLYVHEKDALGCLPYRPLHRSNHIYADGIGMVCPFACAYGVRFHDREAVKLAVKQLRGFFQYGLDEQTGLPYHIYHYLGEQQGQTLGLLGWGRGVGWIMYGLAASLEALEKDKALVPGVYEEVLGNLEKLLCTVADYVLAEGLFSASLLEKAPVDTSGSAMMLYAYRYYAELGKRRPNEVKHKLWENAQAIYQKGLGRLQAYCVDGKVLQAQSECLGVGEYGQDFGSYPWSVGMTLCLLKGEGERCEDSN